MSRDDEELSLLERLRSDFDRGFAARVRPETDAWEELLGLRTGEGRYAVQLRQIAAVHPIRAVTRVPGRRAGFEGLIAVHGQLVAVYDLAVLVAAGGATKACRWLLIGRDEPRLGFAFDAVEGYRRVPRASLAAAGEGAGGVVTMAIEDGESPRLLLDLEALGAEVGRSVGRSGGRR